MGLALVGIQWLSIALLDILSAFQASSNLILFLYCEESATYCEASKNCIKWRCCAVRDLAPPGELTSPQTHPFEFTNAEMQYDSYRGLQVRLRSVSVNAPERKHKPAY